jgi:hypothetical protein
MLLRLILLVTLGVLLIGGAFLWIDRINDETRMAEKLNNVPPPRRIVKKPQDVAVGNTTTTVKTTATTTNSSKESASGVDNSTKSAIDPGFIGSHIAKLQNTIKEIPNQLMSTGTGSNAENVDSDDQTASRLALDKQSAYALPALTRQQAAFTAKASAGKNDPLSPIFGFKQFPAFSASKTSINAGNKPPTEKTDMIPPPPAGSIPPPPPPILTGQQGDSLPLAELPTPPERPSIAKHLKLVGILGDRAFMTVTDAYVRKANHLPKTLSVSAGDRVDFLNVIAVTDNAVTLEEDGQRLVKHLPLLR